MKIFNETKESEKVMLYQQKLELNIEHWKRKVGENLLYLFSHVPFLALVKFVTREEKGGGRYQNNALIKNIMLFILKGF